MDNGYFHAAYVLGFLAFFLIRVRFFKKARRERGTVTYREGRGMNWLRGLLGLPLAFLMLGYLVRPSILAGGALALPEWARWLGLAMWALCLVLIYWVQVALGDNFDTQLGVHDRHTLVTHGPYRWVRHPMYTVFYLMSLATLLLTSNLWAAATIFVPFTLVLVLRIRNEEALMLETFGDDYAEYMLRTGRFLPRLGGA